MNRQTTWGVVSALVLVGMIGASLQPGAKSGGDNGAVGFGIRGKQARPKASHTSAAEKKRACDDLAQVLEVFLAVTNMPRPESCIPDDPHATAKASAKSAVVPGAKLDPRFIIATLPDPIHTHLALMFDRMAEVIQQAAQDENYSYEASWLPWEDKEETYLHLEDDDQASYRKDLVEEQPGVLVFRSSSSAMNNNEVSAADSEFSNDRLAPYRNGLIVFVVGEDPTKGIHIEQFTNALAWIEKLKGLDDNARARTVILGPTFSGSFASLTKLLSGSDSGKYLREIRGSTLAPLAIHSGTANGGDAIRTFEVVISSPSLRSLNVNFHGFLERDDVGLERYCEFLQEQHYELKAVAIVSEDETAYGRSGHNEGNDSTKSATGDMVCNGALRLYYPRDISALRSAYQTNSVFSTNAPQQSTASQRGRLPTDLADPEGQNHDTIRSYAGNQTALSQEAYLLGTVNTLRGHHIEHIILRSTNALDELFLASYLRRAYPDARIVTDNSDRLFERERGATGMSGTTSLSTYPLLESERKWIGGAPSPSQRLFNSDTSEGTYIALRLLLHTQALSDTPNAAYPADKCSLQPEEQPSQTITTEGSLPSLPSGCNPPVPLPDYGTPSWMIPKECLPHINSKDCDSYWRPGTWQTVLGRDGYWAIADLNEYSATGKAPDRGPIEGGEGPEIPLSMKLWLVFLAGFVCFHAWCCWRASFTAKPSFLSHFANPGEMSHAVLVFLGGMLAALMPLFAGLGCGAFDPASAGLPYRWLVLGIVLLECVIALGSSVANVLRVAKLRNLTSGTPERPEGSIDPGRMITWVFVGSVLGFIAFFVAFALPLQRALTSANRFLTYYRNMHLLSGVSPLVPLLTLTLGMYAWFWHSLHGLALFGADRCRLPKETDLQLPDPEDPKRNKRLDILRMFSQERAAAETERGAKPLVGGIVIRAGVIFFILFAIVFAISRGLPVRSLGGKYFNFAFFVYLTICFSVMLANTWQLLRTWARLRELLMFLDRTPLRRTLAALRGFSWGSVWEMSGNVLDVRYKLLSRQLESLGHTLVTLDAPELAKNSRVDGAPAATAVTKCIGELKNTHKTGIAFAKWYAANYRNRDAENPILLEAFQKSTAKTTATLLVSLLLPEWQTETNSLILVDAHNGDDNDHDRNTAPPISSKKHICDAEEFVCLPYMGFVQNILGRMRSIVMSILWLFVATAIAISSYPFDPRQGLSGVMLVLFVLLGATIFYVYAQMHRDATLSHVTNTTPGELGSAFWLKILSFGIAPALGLLTTLFPGIGDFVFSWLQPGLQSIK